MNISYDKDNIFAKILKSEIPCNKILENEYALAFSDINPQAPKHILVNDIIEHFKLEDKGFRLITNSGNDGNQDVPHFHIHILGGKNLGRMIN